MVATALSLSHLGSLMRGVRSVDEVGADERAASLAKRSIKKSSKLWALDLALRCMDRTTLEGSDTPGKVAALCAKAIRPKPGDASIPSVAAICVYPLRVPDAREHLKGSTVRVASVATAFPSGQSFTSIKVDETRETVAAGADEVDMVIDRGAFLSGDYQRVYDEIVAVKEACGSGHDCHAETASRGPTAGGVPGGGWGSRRPVAFAPPSRRSRTWSSPTRRSDRTG
jgi:deoxyribose-phosphate aldolase